MVRRRYLPRHIAIAAVIGLVASAASACSGGGNAHPSGAPTHTLSVAQASVTASMDPAQASGTEDDYDLLPESSPLVRYAKLPANYTQLQGITDITGEVAKSWTRESNGDYIFDLRAARSPAGNLVTAKDVQWSIQRALKIGSVEEFLANLGDINAKDPVTILSPTSVRVNVTAPSVLTLAILTYYGFNILDLAALKTHITASDPWATTYLAAHTADFAPYQIKSFQSGSQLTLIKNPNYWGGPYGSPYFDEIAFRTVPDAATRVSLITSGAVQFVTSVLPSQLKALKGEKGSFVADPTPGADQLVLQTLDGKPPFNNVKVRQAMSMALNRQAIVSAIYSGFGTPADSALTGAIPQPPLTAEEKQYTVFNDQKAKSLLAAAGYPNGFTMTLDINSAGGPGPEASNLAALVQGELGAVGIKVNIVTVASSSAFVTGYFNHTYQAEMFAGGSLLADPAYWVLLEWTPSGNKVSDYYSNSQLTQLAQTAAVTANGPARTTEIEKIESILANEMPTIPLVNESEYWVRAASVTGIEPDPDGSAYLQDAR
jgi:peptide/nickel transport system substrate-binding protein